MVLMEKDKSLKYVPDVFVEYHRAQGYKVVGEPDEVQAPEEEVQPTKTQDTKKKQSSKAKGS